MSTRIWLSSLTCAAAFGVAAFEVRWGGDAVAGEPHGSDSGEAADTLDETPGPDDDHDGKTLTFATVGDSRQDPDPAKQDPTTKPLSAQDQYWLQNSKAFSRIMASIQKQRAKMLVFNGDMIMGYGRTSLPSDTSTIDKVLKSDLVRTYREYSFWRGMIAPLMEAGVYVLPVPGNHETQSKALGKTAQVENENAWRANMGDLILDANRFQTLFGEQPANADVTDTGVSDGRATDQTQLTYSFDFHGSHFAVVNTDPVGADAHAPTQWLANDLAAAKARGVQHCFVFGHKPAFTYSYGTTVTLPATPSGLDQTASLAARDAFWAVIEQYGATYFCGHEHIYNLSQPTVSSGGHAWQVLVGSGGSPFEALPTDSTLAVTDRYYAWARVDVYQSGKVRITGYGFNDRYGPTHRLQSVVLSH